MPYYSPDSYLFNEPVTYMKSCFICLTATQNKFINWRLKSQKIKLSHYMRDLIIMDMETLKQRKGGKNVRKKKD